MEFTKIYTGESSSLLGMNGGCPESPDGSRIVYAVKKSINAPETDIMVCNSDLTGHRKVFSVMCGNHNGPSATFIDGSKIVFRDNEGGLSVFRIMDIDTGEVLYKIFAKESHCAENGKYPFSLSGEFLGKNPDYPEINQCGIYVLDVNSGKITLAASEDDIKEMVSSRGFTVSDRTAAVSHVQLNPSGTAVMMRLGVPECPVFGALGCIDIETRETHIIPDKPVHQLWFDDDTYMATRQFNRGKIIECESSYIARFSKDGEELEVLGGIGNHIDSSPDRQLFVGDRCYPGYQPNVYLYRRGSKKPIAVFEVPDFQEIVWKKQVHMNPSFSRDGKRLYFNRPVSNDKTEAVFVDISKIIS